MFIEHGRRNAPQRTGHHLVIVGWTVNEEMRFVLMKHVRVVDQEDTVELSVGVLLEEEASNLGFHLIDGFHTGGQTVFSGKDERVDHLFCFEQIAKYPWQKEVCPTIRGSGVYEELYVRMLPFDINQRSS